MKEGRWLSIIPCGATNPFTSLDSLNMGTLIAKFFIKSQFQNKKLGFLNRANIMLYNYGFGFNSHLIISFFRLNNYT